MLDPGFEDMIEKIGAAKNVDEAIAAHLRFLETSVVTLLMYQVTTVGLDILVLISIIKFSNRLAIPQVDSITRQLVQSQPSSKHSSAS